MLRIGAVIILHKDHADPVIDIGIGIDLFGKLIDELHEVLCHDIAGGGLCAEDECGGRHIGEPALLQFLIDVNDGKRIHELTLVFVHTLDLNVEHKAFRDLHALLFKDYFAEPVLELLLDADELPDQLLVYHGLKLF